MKKGEKKSIHIGIDIRTIHQGGGCATYLQHLLPALVASMPEVEWHLFTNRREQPKFLPQTPAVKLHHCLMPKPLLLLYDWFVVPLRAWSLGLHLFHCPKSATSPLYRLFGIPTVTTIHDVVPLTHPETEKRLNHLYWSIQIPLAYRVSDRVITISRFAKTQLEQLYGLRQGVSVIYHGADHGQGQTGIVERQWPVLKERLGLRRRYILYLGSIQPRKRVLELIQAYWSDPVLREQFDCVIAGQQGWLSKNVADFVQAQHAQQYIRLIGAVSDDERAALYSNASVFAYLSIDEGFGFPILEAMAAEVPVIIADTSCLPEIAGGSALCVDARNQDEIVRALHTVLDTNSTAETLVIRGRARAAAFTWQRCARQTRDVYLSLLKEIL